MISTPTVGIDIHKHMVGIIAEALPNAPVSGDSVKVFIPELMPKVKIESPKQVKIQVNCVQMFLNDESCRPSSKNVIKTQNYITVKVDNHVNWNNMSEYYYTSDKYKVPIFYLKSGEKVICHTPTGKFSHMIFNTTDYDK
jgi:hypothetical protein